MAITDGPNSLFISSQSKSASRVGHDILAYCNRCKMNLTHTIVTIEANNKNLVEYSAIPVSLKNNIVPKIRSCFRKRR